MWQSFRAVIPGLRHSSTSKRCCLLTVGLMLLIGNGCREMSQEALDQRAIEVCFREFRDSVVDRNGELACNSLSQSSFDHFEQLRLQALDLTPDELQSLPLHEKVDVLLLRDRLTGDELVKLDGKQLLSRYVSEGWINDKLFRNTVIGNVIHKGGDRRRRRIADGEGLMLQRFGFSREADSWRFQLDAALAYSGQLYVTALERSKKSPGEFLKELLIVEAKRRPIDSLWEPLRTEKTTPTPPAAAAIADPN